MRERHILFDLAKLIKSIPNNPSQNDVSNLWMKSTLDSCFCQQVDPRTVGCAHFLIRLVVFLQQSDRLNRSSGSRDGKVHSTHVHYSNQQNILIKAVLPSLSWSFGKAFFTAIPAHEPSMVG